MFDHCPLIDSKCAMCAEHEGEHYCGQGLKTKEGIINEISRFQICPLEVIKLKKSTRAPSRAESGFSSYRVKHGYYK